MDIHIYMPELIQSAPLRDSFSCSRVYMDSDLEFHRFPDLFLNNGSWPYYDRDAMFFNYWGNETAPATKFTAHIGSGVMYFNNGIRAHNLLRAWTQAMAYPPNLHAPDDQVSLPL